MKTAIRNLYAHVKNIRQSISDERNLSRKRKFAQALGFSDLVWLGTGKDSTVFKGNKAGKEYVVKILSDYGKKYFSITEKVVKNYDGPEFMKIDFIGNEALSYPYTNLRTSNLNPKDLLKEFSHVCDYQISLMKHGMLMWDFGITGLNYMFDGSQLKIIDYGGNAFLFLDKSQAPEIQGKRKNLVYARNEFVQQSLLLHFIVLGIGQTTAAKWGSWIQDNDDFNSSRKTIENYLEGTIYEKLGKLVFSLDLTDINAWVSLREQIKTYFDGNSVVALDKADIDKVTFERDHVTVLGYQNYRLSKADLQPFDKGHDWANTKVKWSIISDRLKKLQFKDYLDIGSNLGLYVFTANVLCGAKASGIDYNEKYIDNCREISKYLNLNCDFETKSFAQIEKKYDCVTMLGVIHHIYSRTESFGNLEKIMSKLNDITNKYLIIEFPTEKDSKAMKWINIPSRETDNDYNLENFLKISGKFFKTIEHLDSTTPERPVYFLSK